MKRSLLFTKHLKQTILAVPAAALMLGAAQAGTTVGLNFQSWYYDSGANPQTIGFNNGYSDYNTTGFPVTTNAFGVNVANWFNTDPMGSEDNANPINQVCTFGGTVTNFAGGLSCNVNSPLGTYSSGAGELQSLNTVGSGYLNITYAPGVWTPPGDDEVFWGNIIGNDAKPFSVSVTGLAAKFPNGYVIQSMSALGAENSNGSYEYPLLPSVDFTDGTTTNTSAYHIYYVQNNPDAQWKVSTVGISDPSGAFTADTIHINSRADGTGINSSLAGFIITDKPVVTQDPQGGKFAGGSSFTLSADVIGITNGLHYQWQNNDTDILGANSPVYTKAGATIADSGNYTLVVTNISGVATSGVATVVVVATTANPLIWKGNVNGSWDIGTTANWESNGVAMTYDDGHTVRFDDTATTTSVNNTVAVNPVTITVTNNTQNYTISGSPISTFSLTKSGTKTLTLTGNDTFGSVAVNNGVIQFGDGTVNPALNGPFAISSGADLYLNYATATNLTWNNITGAGTFELNSAQAVNGSANWSQPALTAGFTGTLQLDNGRINANPANLGGASTIVINNGSQFLAYDGTFTTNTFTNNFAINGMGWGESGFNNGALRTSAMTTFFTGKIILTGNSGLYTQQGNQPITVVGPISDGGLGYSLAINGASPITFTGTNTYTGPTTINTGTGLIISGAGQLGGGSYSGDIADNTAFTYNSSAAQTLSGAISGTGSLTNSGSGTLTLKGVNTYSGGTMVNAGTLTVSGQLTGDGLIALADNTTLIVTGAGNTPAISTATAGLLAGTGSGVNTLGFAGLSSTNVAPITMAGSVDFFNPATAVKILSLTPMIGTYPLIQAVGSGYIDPGTLTLPNGYTGTLSNDLSGASGTLYLIVTGVPVVPVSIVTDLSGATDQRYTGATYTLSVVPYGTPPFTYLWTHDGMAVGSNSPTLVLAGLTSTDAGAYTVKISNTLASVQSATNHLVVVQTPGYDALVMSANPVSYWPLAETSGNTAFDIYGDNNAIYSGTYTLNAATNPQTGIAGAHFDGTNGLALTSYVPALNPDVFTAEAWVNPDNVPASEYCPLSCGQFASARFGWLIYQFAGYWDFRTYYGAGTATAAEAVGTTAPVIGAWTHLAVSWDGTNASLYVNGVLEASSVSSGVPAYLPGASGGFSAGARADNAFFFPGTVSGAALYNRVLTPAEILSHATYTAPTTPSLITVTRSGADLILSWTSGSLQAAPEVTGTYTNVPAATSPYTVTPTEARQFFRLTN